MQAFFRGDAGLCAHSLSLAHLRPGKCVFRRTRRRKTRFDPLPPSADGGTLRGSCGTKRRNTRSPQTGLSLEMVKLAAACAAGGYPRRRRAGPGTPPPGGRRSGRSSGGAPRPWTGWRRSRSPARRETGVDQGIEGRLDKGRGHSAAQVVQDEQVAVEVAPGFIPGIPDIQLIPGETSAPQTGQKCSPPCRTPQSTPSQPPPGRCRPRERSCPDRGRR